MVLNSKKGIEFINTKFLSKCPLVAVFSSISSWIECQLLENGHTELGIKQP